MAEAPEVWSHRHFDTRTKMLLLLVLLLLFQTNAKVGAPADKLWLSVASLANNNSNKFD